MERTVGEDTGAQLEMERWRDGKIESKIIRDEKICSGWRRHRRTGRAPARNRNRMFLLRGKRPFLLLTFLLGEQKKSKFNIQKLF